MNIRIFVNDDYVNKTFTYCGHELLIPYRSMGGIAIDNDRVEKITWPLYGYGNRKSRLADELQERLIKQMESNNENPS